VTDLVAKRGKSARPRASQLSLRDRILEAVGKTREEGLAFSRLEKRVGEEVKRDTLRRLVDSMVLTGRLIRLDRGRLVNPEPMGWVVGRLRITRKGIGFVIPDGALGEDLLIPRRGLSTAVDGDRVVAQVVGRQRGRDSGSIVTILERAHARLVGQYFHGAHRARIVPRSKWLDRLVEVTPLPRKQVRDGEWVVAEITHWPPGEEPLGGRVAEVIGPGGTPDEDLEIILAMHNVDPEFTPEALKEVERIPLEIPPETIEGRRDLRGERIFTIDPATAKDFDDALSIEALGESRWRLGVHIADVAEHVKAHTALDETARWRGTSIYPVDRVIPMLPERLSDIVCSLRPDEDSLTVSVFLVIDSHGDVVEAPDMCESVIHSVRRLDYGQVQCLFDDKLSEEDRAAVEGLEGDLRALLDVSRALMEKRRRRGALDLDLPEIELVLDEDRRVAEVFKRPRWDSHRLVEECMLAANEAVAWYLLQRKIPSIHRDHDEPDPERLAQLLPALRALGVKQRISLRRIQPRDYQELLIKTRDLEAGPIIHRLLLRTLRLAEYDTENRGHFGLASECYTHFTSPIRRCPDLMVHRLLKSHLRGEPPPQGAAREAWQEELAAIAALSSSLERRAERVERDMTKLKMLHHLEPHLGEEMTGMVTGVSAHGLWIELDEVFVEGFAHISTLGEDWWEFDEERLTLRGEATGTVWRLAQRVRVRLASVDLTALELDVALIGAV
jgi:ribonuclease R